MSKKCTAIKQDGKKCKAFSIAGGNLCYWHSPARAADRESASRKGGKARAKLSQVKEIVADAVATRPELQECQFQTLDDIQLVLESNLFEIEANKKYSSKSHAERVLTLRFCDAIIKVLCLKGLDAEGRISELEDLARGTLFDKS